MKKLKVINSEKENEDFSAEKVYKACIRSGASEKIANEVTEEVKRRVHQGTKTSEIGKIVKNLLSKKSKKSAIKFSLKEAMRKLGPTGFDFEKFIVAVLSDSGFTVKINEHIRGFCISSYEVDFVSTQGNNKKIGECKYHANRGEKVDLKVALYNHARFLDICKHPLFKKEHTNSILVTNAKFTKKAVDYCECNNVELLGWRHPKSGGLEKLIEDSDLYPITILPSFKKSFKNVFAAENIILVKDLLSTSPKQIAKKTSISKQKANKLVEEANILLQ